MTNGERMASCELIGKYCDMSLVGRDDALSYMEGNENLFNVVFMYIPLDSMAIRIPMTDEQIILIIKQLLLSFNYSAGELSLFLKETL